MVQRMIRMRSMRRALTAKAAADQKASSADGDEIKKARKPVRFKPGTQALRDIKYLQRKYHGHLIPKSVIGRLVRETVGNNFYLSRTALHIIHSEIEELAVVMFNKWVSAHVFLAGSDSLFAGRATLRTRTTSLRCCPST